MKLKAKRNALLFYLMIYFTAPVCVPRTGKIKIGSWDTNQGDKFENTTKVKRYAMCRFSY